MRWRRRTDPAAVTALIKQLTVQREQLVAELEVVEADAAWARASDSMAEKADAETLVRQLAALRAELDRLDRRLLRAQLDAFG
ncbi:MAG TPA: hypothetical protein VHX15_18325 [Frankiaceae bacterium]|nr:hypothetical protein [Frankiaceae bacterium]